MTVRTKGRKIGATGEICNKCKHSKTLFVKGRRDDFKASEEKGKEKGCVLKMGYVQVGSARLILVCLRAFRRMSSERHWNFLCVSAQLGCAFALCLLQGCS